MIVWEWLFPHRCAGCQKAGLAVCNRCLDSVISPDPICPYCQRLSFGGMTHLECWQPLGLAGCWSYGLYPGVLSRVIKKLKYRRITAIAQVVVSHLIKQWETQSPLFINQIAQNPAEWLIVPVPLHPSRQRWRGFNQATLLGQELSHQIALPLAEVLFRTRNTRSQVHQNAQSRYHNLKGAFSLAPQGSVEGKHIILIDDVWTTGATLKECAAVLKRGGASAVWGLTIAR